MTRADYDVSETFYSVHVKRDAPPNAPRSLRVAYQVGFNQFVSEWVCVEHEGYARQKAAQWWRTRSDAPLPDSAEAAVELAERGALAPTLAITVERRAGEKFDRIVACRLGEKSMPAEAVTDAPCPGCSKAERTLQPGSGPHAAQEVCAWCGRWLRWVSKDEAESRWAAEVPF